MLVEGSPAPKLLAQHLAAVSAEGGFRLDGLPLFDRAHVQGTVLHKLTGVIRLDDGTGSINIVCPPGGDKPGIELDSVQKGDYLLVIGKLHERQGERTIKAHKLLNLTQPCRAAGSPGEAAAAEAALGLRMMQWNLEVMELHRVFEEAAAATAAGAPAN